MKNPKRLSIYIMIGILSFFLLLKPDNLNGMQSGMDSITGDVSIDIVGGDVIVSRDNDLHKVKKVPHIFMEQGYNFIPALLFVGSIAAVNAYFYRRKNQLRK